MRGQTYRVAPGGRACTYDEPFRSLRVAGGGFLRAVDRADYCAVKVSRVSIFGFFADRLVHTTMTLHARAYLNGASSPWA